MKELVNLNNRSYEIEYENPLTPEQMNYVYKQIENTKGCITCNKTLGKIYTLGNIISNPSIESDPSIGPTFRTYDTVATYSWASDAARSGTRSLKIISTAAPGVMSRWTTQYFPVSAGTQYYSSAYLKTSATTGYATVAITWWSGVPGTTTYLSSSLSNTTLTGSTEFSKIEVNPKAPATAIYGRIEFRLYGAGTLWIDDVSFDATAPSLTPCPSESMSPGDVLELKASASGGTAPYTVNFKKGGSNLPSGTFYGITEGEIKTYQYTILSTDVPSVGLEAYVTDSCGTPVSCSKSCIVLVASVLECPATTCEFIITKVG